MSAKRIVYLLGAGATHAEIMNLEQSPDEVYRVNFGLLISDVSKRVMIKAHRNRKPWFLKQENIIASKKGSFNIELYISLLESNQAPDEIITYLKTLVESDIERVLSEDRKSRCFLHKALLELHALINTDEQLLGLISVNYDILLDEAFKEVTGNDPEYCHTSEHPKQEPILKLHGSFNWKNIPIYGKIVTIPIIPLGINKNYLIPPYNFIWGRAYELLTQCDILRVIGCSLNQSDVGLIDLLFKVHNQKRESFEIQIVDFQPKNGHHQIKNNYGFFPNIVDPRAIEGTLISDELSSDDPNCNPFKIWLAAKARRTIDSQIPNTKYLKLCL